jgi:hypothetical protein
MNIKDPKFTARLEPALRALARNPDNKLASLAERYDIEKGDLAMWLGEYNGGNKLLAAKRIDEVKQQVGGVVVTRITDKAPPAPAAVKGPGANLGKWIEDQKISLQGIAQTYIIRVAPPLAAAWLSLNKGNRNPSKAKIRRFARSIAAGKWVLNGETIKFSATGRLLDGQSRLLAIIQANTPAVLEIRGGLADLSQQAMDIGEARKGTHTLEMLGEKYPSLVSSGLRMISRWETDTLSGNKFGVSSVLENQDIPALLAKHSGLRSSVGWVVSSGHKIKHLLSQSEAAFFHYLFGLAHAKKRDVFFTALADGIGLTPTSPAYHLRERLIAERSQAAKVSPRDRLALVIKAWNAHQAGEQMSLLRFISTGESKEKFPAVAGVSSQDKKVAA